MGKCCRVVGEPKKWAKILNVRRDPKERENRKQRSPITIISDDEI